MRIRYLLLLLLLPFSLAAQTQVSTGFELDGDLYDTSGSTQSAQDWFTDSPKQLFYGSQVDSVINLFNSSNNLAQRNFSFFFRGENHSSSDYKLIDALYQRDYISAASAKDATTFITGASKNADHPDTWDISSQGSPQKADLVDIFSMLRRAGNSPSDDLWFLGAASTLTANGDKHIDVEFYKKELVYENESFTSQGSDGGRTAWMFGPQGEIIQAGDIIVSLDFVKGGKDLEKSIRIWVDASSFPNDDLTSLNSFLPFQLTGVFNTGKNSGSFGYAEIQLSAGSTDLIVLRNSTGTKATPWGTLSGPQASLSNDYLPNQWVEIGLNLSSLGLDPNQQAGIPCGAPLGTVLVKTRSSHSFTAQLKDFVVPMSFGQEAEWDLALSVPELSCKNETVIPETGNLPPDFSFTWKGPNSFYSEETHPELNTAGTYTVTASLAQGCIIRDTIELEENKATSDLQLTGGTLTCEELSIDLGATSNVPNTHIQWKGPDGQIKDANQWTVDQPGLYFATATHPQSACQVVDSVEVLSNTFTPKIETQDLTLTCFQPSTKPVVNLDQTGNYQYNWTGPNGFMSKELRPIIDTEGTYRLSLKNLANGCESEGELEVMADFMPPVLAFQDDTISCLNTQIQLRGDIQAGTNYQVQWTGPNGFSSTEDFPFVDSEGIYQLEVINKDNGCSSTTSLSVLDKQVFENFRLQGGELSCVNEQVLLSAGLSGNKFTYQWSGPNGFSSTSNEVYVDESGTYTLHVSHTNGCSMEGAVTVTSSINIPQVSLPDSLDLTCVRASWRPSGLPSTYRYQWTGDNGYTSTSNSPSINRTGTYTLTVSDPNSGCDTSLTVIIGENKLAPSVSISGGILTCSNPTTELSFEVEGVSNYTFYWLLPSGLISRDTRLQADAGGLYRLYVKNPDNGCLTISTYTVKDENIPITLRARAGALTCVSDSAKLEFTASPSGSFAVQWTGPQGFTSTLDEVYVSQAGTYTLSVTNSNTGCSAIDQVVVVSNKNVPQVNLPDSLDLTCVRTSWRPALSSSYRYQWSSDNGFSSTSNSPNINRAGTYTVRVSDPRSNCDTTLSVVIGEDFLAPTVRIQGGDLTCKAPSTELSFEVSGVSNYTFYWLLPNGQISRDQSLTVDTEGRYRLYVKNPKNGCLSLASYTVRDENQPISLRGTAGTLTCETDSVQLGFTATPASNLSINWKGPNGFTSTEANPWVGEIGTYHLQVTDSVSGCSGFLNLQVRGDFAPPVITVRKSGDLNCQSDQVLLYAFPSNNYSFEWYKQLEIIGTGSSVAVREAGNYTVQVKNLTTGCVKIEPIQVEEYDQVPSAFIYLEDSLSCMNTSVRLRIEDQEASAHTYVWRGPDGFYSTQAEPIANKAGTYTLTIRDITSTCDTVLTLEILGDPSPLSLQAQGGTLTCINTDVQLRVNYEETRSVSFSWTGPNGFVSTEAEPRVSAPGTYRLTLTDNTFGCQAQVNVQVLDKSQTPHLQVGSGTLGCAGSSTQLTAQYNLGSYDFQWTGPNGFSSQRSSPMVAEKGTYTLQITDKETGCFNIASTEVVRIASPIAVSIVSQGELTCRQNSVQLSGQHSVSNASYSWTGPNGFYSDASTVGVMNPGTYTLELKDLSSGCSGIDSLVVESLDTRPAISLEIDGELTCTEGSVQLSAGNTDANLSYYWTGPDRFTSEDLAPVVSAPGIYVLTLLNPESGCSALDSIEIVRTQTALPVNILSDGKLTCIQSSIELSIENPRNYLLYEWKGPQGFGSDEANPLVTEKGTYYLTIIDAMSQCTGMDSIKVHEDLRTPSIAVADTGLSCEHSFLELGTDLPQGLGYQYQWLGPNNFNASTAKITVEEAGNYLLRVTHSVTGCETLDTLRVAEMPACSDAVCTMTQGFYGNDNGRFCDGRTTRAVLEGVLATDLVLGGGTNTFTLSLDELDDFFKRMPGGGTSEPLDGIATCANPVGIALDRKGQFSNNLLAQTLTLGINLRLGPGLGDVVLEDSRMITFASSDCQDTESKPVSGTGRSFNLPTAVIKYLKQPTIAGLYAFANAALEGSYVPQAGSPGYGEITAAVGAINDGFDKCRILKEFQQNEEETPEWVVSGYPNPTSGEPVSVSFSALGSGTLSLTVHDMITGITLAIPMSEEVQIGESYEVSFPVDQLPEGTYLYLLRLDGEIVGRGNIQVYH